MNTGHEGSGAALGAARDGGALCARAARTVLPCGILSLVHEMHNSWGSVPLPEQTSFRSRRAGRHGYSAGATGAVVFCRWMGRLRRPWGNPNCEAMIPKAKAIEGEPIRTSRIYARESQSTAIAEICCGLCPFAPAWPFVAACAEPSVCAPSWSSLWSL
jgi:hypothetical protein